MLYFTKKKGKDKENSAIENFDTFEEITEFEEKCGLQNQRIERGGKEPEIEKNFNIYCGIISNYQMKN